MVTSMSLLTTNNMFSELSNDELLMIEGGDIPYDIGYGIGVIIGILYDAADIMRAVYTGSF